MLVCLLIYLLRRHFTDCSPLGQIILGVMDMDGRSLEVVIVVFKVL